MALIASIARIVAWALLAGWLGAGLGCAIFGPRYEDYVIASVLFACAGGIVGAVAGAAGQIVNVLRQRPSGPGSQPRERDSHTDGGSAG
jgi:hypothetical protein